MRIALFIGLVAVSLFLVATGRAQQIVPGRRTDHGPITGTRTVFEIGTVKLVFRDRVVEG
jgi:hypothetical protein